MNMNLTEIEAIDKKIRNLNVENGIEPVYDGIVNIDKYSKQDIKILWILKEVNDMHDDGNVYGGYDMRTALRDLTVNSKGNWRNTFNPIIYTSYGILNNFMLWDEMGNTYKDQNIVSVLEKIAFINLKKIPGNSRSDMSAISKEYFKHREIILEQINSFRPNVIIGGNTLNILKDDLKIEFIDKYPISFALKQNQIYIDAYHPNNRTIKQEDYCNSIINCVKQFIN